MRAWARVGAVVAALVVVGEAHASSADGLGVSVDRTTVATRLGRSFVFHSTVTNRGTTPATGLIAHLNVLSLRGDVYIDPEDWSSHRTRYLATLPPGGSTTLTWKLDTVNAGRIGVYVAVLLRTGGTPVAGPLLDVDIADRRTLDAGGILPLALGLPALLGLLAVALRLRRRKGLRVHTR